MRRSLDVPPKREIVFVSFVRVSGRGEAACLRERDNASVAGLPILEFFSSFASSPPPPSMEYFDSVFFLFCVVVFCTIPKE